MNISTRYALGILSLVISAATWASSVTVPNTFTANTPAKAAQVNADFAALVSAINTLESTISTLQTKVTNQTATINTLQSQLSSVNDSQVMALNPYLTVDTTSDSRGPLVKLSGVNLQVVNGMGSTDTSNGLGNIIIGYDEADASSRYHCTVGYYSTGNTIYSDVPTDATNCSTAGGTWTNTGFKTGSHNLVLGRGNNYSSYGGIISGSINTSNSPDTLVNGFGNTASGFSAAVLGGADNVASGAYDVVSGGDGNTASAQYSSVSGGSYNTASGEYSSVSGGSGNTASGNDSSILGGNGVTTASTYQTNP